MIFCTLFNQLYLPQGVALYRSLERQTGGNFTLYILCMDDFTHEAVSGLQLPHARPIALSEIEDDTLRTLRPHRSVGEYCWTCTSPLLLHVLRQQPADTVVAYVDADLYFFSDPSAVLREMGGASIYIHEHDFAPKFAHLRAQSGRFNVGLVLFRNDAEGMGCLEKWKRQCIDECVMDPAAGKCGDQQYLDEWPSLYSALVIASNPGVGLGPWNLDKRRINASGQAILADGSPVVFYHYHSLRMLRPQIGLRPVAMAIGYEFGPDIVDIFYRPYVRELWRAWEELEQRGYSLTRVVPTVAEIYGRALDHQLLFTVAGWALPTSSNKMVLKVLLRYDAYRGRLQFNRAAVHH
jgi:hypothetical protein